MSLPLPRVVALAPGGIQGTAVVEAAGRAGALGVLDLSMEVRELQGPCLVEAMSVLRRPFAIRIGSDQIGGWVSSLPKRMTTIICQVSNPDEIVGVVRSIRDGGRRIVLEVTRREDAACAEALQVDGLLASGLEAGGVCGQESTLVLLQALLADGHPRIWVRGGIGPRSAAASIAAGASGVVVDGALLLARESPLAAPARTRVAASDGGDTLASNTGDGRSFRVLPKPLASTDVRPTALDSEAIEIRSFNQAAGWSPDRHLPVGQDAAFAAELAGRYLTVGGIVQAVEASIDRDVDLARMLRPFAPGSPLAISHGTRFPIVQGPMTRVSDRPAFAAAVAKAGAVPFLAVGMLRGEELRTLLSETTKALGRYPWGTGILGFIDRELYREQIDAVLAAAPGFAILAGGQPYQAAELESAGIASYLHAPSPGLLRSYLSEGTRRIVLEGRECGGHVGPRSSLVLWEQAVEVLLEACRCGTVPDPASLHVLLAGGLHDARSAAAAATFAAPLAERGAKVGILAGSVYLFAREAVETGAILPAFQDEALRCRRTVLLRTAPGHEVRVSPTPFVEAFEAERQSLVEQGASPAEIRDRLEHLNAGRLRAAAKGLARPEGANSQLIQLGDAEQRRNGLFMMGQVAALRDRPTTLEEIHRDLSEGSGAMLKERPFGIAAESRLPTPSDIAIVGMSAIFPGSENLEAFWQNTLEGRDAIIEVPPDRWDWRPYYDRDPRARDKVISRWGGFLPDIPFDPLTYGMPPSSLTSIEPVQLLVLEAAKRALADAGYERRAFPRERTAVVLGMGGGAAQLAMGYAFRSYLPMLDGIAPGLTDAFRDRLEPLLPEWTEDSFPGFLLNVAAGRIANRLDLGGANYTVDAACGSSLAAAAMAVRELETGVADMVLLGGADTVQNPFTYLAFSKTHAFSPRGRCRPFDESADGIVISEGVGVVVLKRLADAERDGDRIYAVIKGIGSSSDGRERGLTAPNSEGQARALRRAYEKAGIDPATVGYVEAHGTGTAVGDVVEVNALASHLGRRPEDSPPCVVGSIKSMIGHTKCAAGLAGLINATLALHHRVLPPTIGLESINPKLDLDQSAIQLNTRRRPWLHRGDRPRRAGVSAFGFGGTNFHAVLESYEENLTPKEAALAEWPAELMVWRDRDRNRLIGRLDQLLAQLAAGAEPRLRDLAHALATDSTIEQTSGPAVAIVATSLDDLRSKVESARNELGEGRDSHQDRRGVYLGAEPAFRPSELAFLFPGQGSQALEMLGELAVTFEPVRSGFEDFDGALVATGFPPITPRIFPPTTLDDRAREAARLALTATENAQVAVGAASVSAQRLLAWLGLSPAVVAGHSYGELVALHAAGCLDLAGLANLSATRGRLLRSASGHQPGMMAAIGAGEMELREILPEHPGVVLANLNGPRQVVIAGPRDPLLKAVEACRERGYRCFELCVSAAFHSPQFEPCRGPFIELASQIPASSPNLPVFSNVDAAVHPEGWEAIAARLGRHLSSTVQFSAMIRAMYDRGARVFVECGPGAVLSPLVDSILGDAPHLAVSIDQPGRDSITTLLHALGRLFVGGLSFQIERLTEPRKPRRLDLAQLDRSARDTPSPSTWIVNGSRARPIEGQEPRRLGQAIELLRVESRSASPANGHAHREAVAASLPRLDPLPQARTTSAEGADQPISNGHSPARLAALRPAGSRNGPSKHGHRDRGSTSMETTGRDRVIEEFQRTMREFLHVQHSTMLAYLGAPAPVEQDGGRGDAGQIAPVETNGHQSSSSVPVPSTHLEDPPAVELPAPVEPDPPSESPIQGSVTDLVLDVVQRRTGYPREMLSLDVNLEGELGIDSIKRVEILATVKESLPYLAVEGGTQLMEELSRASTLGQIIRRIDQSRTSPKFEEVSEPGWAPRDSSSAPVPVVLGRLVPEPVVSPRPPLVAGLMHGGLVIITDDGKGLGRELSQLLQARGISTVLTGADGPDLTSRSSSESWLDAIRGTRTITGIVHLSPTRLETNTDLASSDWSAALERELMPLFHLARAASQDLIRAASQGGALLLAATDMGGGFASLDPTGHAFHPISGTFHGFLKTLAREWRDVRIRAVDLDADSSVPRNAAHLLDEILAEGDSPEVGYLEGRRVRLGLTSRPLRRHAAPFRLEAGAPVIVSGGARGIAAVVAEVLAREWKPTLLLLGRSAPPGPEPEEMASITSPEELRSALLERSRLAGQSVQPSRIQEEYLRVVRDREIRRTLENLRALGSTVEYASADVRDSVAVDRTLAAWRRKFGAPAGLIHAAGVIQDKRFLDKSEEQFRRVIDSKLIGAINLLRSVDPASLRFAALFSSVSGRFGNEGQTDYAAANEGLNKLALWLDRRWAGRIVSINWGPWARIGMVADLEDHLARRGLEMIDPEAGAAAFLDELKYGRKGEVEVILSGALGDLEVASPRNGFRPAGVLR